jgi:predicted XRE-type DNA-binding protein
VQEVAVKKVAKKRSDQKPLTEWLEQQLEKDPLLRQMVEQKLVVMRLAQQFAQVMKENGVSQAELGRRLNISQPSVNRFLNKMENPELRSLILFAWALGKNIEVRIVPQ